MTAVEFAAHVREALCWRLIAELVRRHPDRLWVQTDTHSIGSEQAFVIDLHQRNSSLAMFGLPGSNCSPQVVPGPTLNWNEAYDGRDPRDWLVEVERRMGLAAPASIAPSTPVSLGIRFIAALLATKIGDRRPWIAGVEKRWPANEGSHIVVPHTAQWPGKDEGPHGIAPLFVGVWGHEPQLAVVPSGHVWTHAGETTLQEHHRSGGSMVALLAAVAPQLLS